MNLKSTMTFSILPYCVFFFLLGVQPTFAQECQSLDTSLCVINKEYIPGPIQLELKSVSLIDNIRNRSQISLADIIGDCNPEVIVNGQELQILIINPSTGDTLISIPNQGITHYATTVSIANVDGDHTKVLFYTIAWSVNKPDKGRIVCMNLDGTIRWVSDDNHVDKKRENCTGAIGFADFNQDGIPEVYVGNRIFNARTGVILADGGDFGIGQSQSFGVSVAAQLDNDPSDLELAAGYTIYKVNITNPDGPVGNTMTPYTIQVDGQFRDGLTAIGDINGDGILDVVVHSETPQFEARLYAYTLAGGSPTLLAKVIPPANPLNNSKNVHSTNTPVIGRISQSSYSSILIVRQEQLLCYQYEGTVNLTQQWTFPNTDESAGISVALFDFNGDGMAEIILRDETHLRIIDGSSSAPVEIASTACESATHHEGPIVGDFLNNGSSQICTICGSIGTGGFNGSLKIFGSPDSLPPWAPGRKVWNQYAYHINNVNDDLTIPTVQKNNATDLNGRYNSFMEQQSLLDTNGYYRQRAASLYGELGCIYYDPSLQLYTISFDVHNRTDASLTAPAGIPVAFYDGDPFSGGNLLGVYLTSQSIAAGESLLNLTYSISSPPLTQLHMVVNTDMAVFSSVDEDDFDIPECDYADNFSMTIELTANLPDTLMLGTCDPAQLGVFVDTLSNQQGCDSIVIRVVSMHPSDETNVSLQTCDPLQVGTDTLWLQNLQGCDSIVVREFTMHPSDETNISLLTCDSIQVGTDTLWLQNLQGCDSLVITTMTLSPSYFIQETIDTCDQTQAGTDTLYLQTIDGCDSVIVRTTVSTGHYQENTTQIICGSGVNYTDTLIITGGPCDSLFITDYQYSPLDTTLLTESSCDPTQVGEQVTVLQDINGCDSTIITTTSLLPSDVTHVDGFTCVAAEAMHDTLLLTNQFGCDSLVYIAIDYLGIDTQFVQTLTCDSALVGMFVEVISGPFCDTVHVIDRTWAPYSTGLETVISCDPSGPSADTIFLTASSGCDSLHIRNYVYTQIDAEIAITAEDCAGQNNGSILVQQVQGGEAPYQYRLDSGLWQQNVDFNNLPPGNYTLTVQDNNGCTISYNGVIVDAGQQVMVDAGPDRQVEPGTFIDLSVQSTSLLSQIQWQANDPLGCASCVTTSLGPISVSQTVTVQVITTDGCPGQDALDLTFLIEEIEVTNIYIPNSFSPNNDGINDVFSIYGNAQINRIKNLSIFDRWGNALYSRADLPINDPSQGWDGNFRGKLMDAGVYIYVFEVELVDGSVRFYKGDVTLVK